MTFWLEAITEKDTNNGNVHSLWLWLGPSEFYFCFRIRMKRLDNCSTLLNKIEDMNVRPRSEKVNHTVAMNSCSRLVLLAHCYCMRTLKYVFVSEWVGLRLCVHVCVCRVMYTCIVCLCVVVCDCACVWHACSKMHAYTYIMQGRLGGLSECIKLYILIHTHTHTLILVIEICQEL